MGACAAQQASGASDSRVIHANADPRVFSVICRMCDRPSEIHITKFGFICSACIKAGAGWKIVFDRDEKVGRIPIALRERYNLDGKGRPK